MMNSMMRNMFCDMPSIPSADPFGLNMMSSSMAMNPFSRLNSFFPSTAMSLHPSLLDMSGSGSQSYYCSSSVMSMSTDFSGRPRIYESTQSTRSAPGGLRETRSTVRDSASGLHQMSIGHHIRDRGHVIQRSRNQYTGEEEHNEEFVNLDDDEVRGFDEEWERRFSQSGFRPNHHRRPHSLPQIHSSRNQIPSHELAERQLALPAPPTASSSHAQNNINPQKNKMMSQKKHKDKKSKKPYKKP